LRKSEKLALSALLTAIGIVLRSFAIIIVPGFIELSPGILVPYLAGILLGWWTGAIVGGLIGLLGGFIGGGDVFLTASINGVSAAVTSIPLYVTNFKDYDPRTTALPFRVKLLCWLSAWLSEIYCLGYFVFVFGLSLYAALPILSLDIIQVQFLWVTTALLIVSFIERSIGGRGSAHHTNRL